MKARILTLVATLAGCADPAALDVSIWIREATVDQVEIRVVSGSDSSNSTIASCTFSRDETPVGICPFEDGSGRWNGESPLRFVLYGAPGSEIEVEARGTTTLAADRVAQSATSSTAVLPDRAGEIASLDLTLVGRTNVRASCTRAIAPPSLANDVDAAALTAFELDKDPGLEIVAAFDATLARIRYTGTREACAIATSTVTDLGARVPGGCSVVDDSLVAGSFSVPVGQRTVPTPLIAGLCSGGGMVRAFASPGAGRSATFAGVSEPVPGPPERVSTPVLARIVPGENPSLFFLYAGSMPRVGTCDAKLWLVRLGPFKGDGKTSPSFTWQCLSGLHPFSASGAIRELAGGPPIVVRDARQATGDTLIIAGYRGGIGTFNRAGWRKVVEDEREPRRASSALASGMRDALVITLYEDAIAKHELHASLSSNNAVTWELHDKHEGSTPVRPIRSAPRTRLAIGTIGAAESPSVVFAEDGVTHFLELARDATFTSRTLWDNNIVGVQTTLLANIDGLSGAEIIAFAGESPNVYARDATGRLLDGWPLAAPEGGRLHMFVGDIDRRPTRGSRDPEYDLEVVMLSKHRLTVMSLGPGSYDPVSLPWPIVGRDPAASAFHAGDADPFGMQ